MKKIGYKLKENRLLLDVLVILVVSFLLSIPNFSPSHDVYLDDGSQHLMRAYYTYQSMVQEGNANVISSFTNGFGYSWNLFYGPLSCYLIVMMGVVFGAFNLGFKWAMFFILGLAGFFMYQFIHEMTENRNTALLAGIIYMTSPYFFTDIYIRHAIRRMHGVCICTTCFLGII